VFGDFIAFWSAGQAALHGFAAEVHDAARIEMYHQVAVPGVAYVAPWNSPPTFLLMVAPLALLPYPAAALAFLAIGGAVYFYGARKVLPDRRALIFALTLPAALYHIGTVQTGLLVAGISALALVWLDRRPLRAGALVGLLVIKPHLAILWPLFLLFSGRWRAFGAALISTSVFVLLAGLVFGFDAYQRFFDNLAASYAMIAERRVATPATASLYGNLLALGASQSFAMMLHAASAIGAFALAVWLFVRRDRLLAGAALCAATLLISPYLFFYDFTLLAVGAALLGAPRDGFEWAAAILAWSAGLSLALGYLAPLPLCPLAAWLVLWAAVRRARNGAANRPT
jgi:hypothetical protein